MGDVQGSRKEVTVNLACTSATDILTTTLSGVVTATDVNYCKALTSVADDAVSKKN
jgi:hypothetical protein